MSARSYLLIARLSPTTLLFAAFARLCGTMVIYFDAVAPVRSERLVERFARFGIARIDYTRFDCFNPYGNLQWLERVALELERMLFSPEFVSAVAREFPEVPRRDRKVGILLVEWLIAELRPLADLYSVAEYLATKGARVRVLHAPTVLAPYFSKICRHRVRPAVRTTLPFWLLLARHAVGTVYRRVASRLKAIGPNLAADVVNQAPPLREVLYFPHKGVDYGRIYRKDHYYRDDADSAFHPSRILHVELASYMSPLEAETARTQYDAAQVPYHFLYSSPIYSVSRLRSLLRRLPKTRGSFARNLAAFQALARFLAAAAAVAPLQGAKVALVGYDYLFPRSIALALQAIGVRVVAVQERFLAPFAKSHFLILDHYFVQGELARRLVAANQWSCIDQIAIVGDPRLDLLVRYQQKVAAQSDLVLVLDFHSEADPFSNAQRVSNSWANNALFYSHIVALADRFTSLRFVIRGKDDLWTGIPALDQIRREIERRPNIVINREYTRFDESYRLAAAARAIVCRYTSMADQCLATGQPVFIHEPLTTGSRLISWLHDYAPYPILTRSLEELECRIDALFSHNSYMPRDTFAEMRRSYYAFDSDISVRERLGKALEVMVGELKAPPAQSAI